MLALVIAAVLVSGGLLSAAAICYTRKHHIA